MKKILPLFAVMLVLPLLGSDSPREYDSRMQRVGLNGSWTVVSARSGGRNDSDFLQATVLTIKGNQLTLLKNGVKEEKGTLRIDASAKPARLDYTPGTGKEQGPALPMIYRLDGDTLTIGFIFQLNLLGPAPAPKRPANFDDNEAVVIVLKRCK